MNNKKHTSLISILLIILCLSLCVGATYAYFTDSVTSAGNKIKAGNLKIDLELLDKGTNQWNSIKESKAPIFNYELWEPGYTDVKLLKVENEGNLAIKWEAMLVSTEAVSAFANAIEVYVQKSDAEIAYPADRAAALAWTKVGTLDQFINTAEKLASGTFTAQGEAYYIGIAFYMPAEITDNTLQGKVLGAFDIQINATQLPYESDAFDENYDADAGFSSSEAEQSIIIYEQLGAADYYTVMGVTDYRATSVVIPATYQGLPVKAIGELAFNCIKFQGDELHEQEVYCQSLTTVILPDGLEYIGAMAFGDCKKLKEINIPDSVTYIGEYAFHNCLELESITTVPAGSISVDSIYAFADCSSLKNFTFPDGTTMIPAGFLAACSSLETVVLPEGLESIGEDAFLSCYSLKNVYLPDSVLSVGKNVFSGCEELTSITIPSSVTRFNTSMFYGCRSLSNITYKGTIAQWNAIEKFTSEEDGQSNWNYGTGDYIITCTDGKLAKDGTPIVD